MADLEGTEFQYRMNFALSQRDVVRDCEPARTKELSIKYAISVNALNCVLTPWHAFKSRYSREPKTSSQISLDRMSWDIVAFWTVELSM